ncbi:semaphorin-1A-like isoform X3 [Limulus polyphemus]|uniref:Semaphorin-1A-like isoform X3 n=1 Tax=Limulus polyphemus TaxID=6850 RepID=A0ABM1B0N2_LIMPO|nr:semaphorin-1A-like isoform X3 [Limulus polyphemus]
MVNILGLCTRHQLLFFFLYFIESRGAWQDGVKPKVIPKLQEHKVDRFPGNQTHSDHFKLLERDGNYLLVGAKNIVYNISLATLQEKKRLEWYSSDDDIHVCRVKGKSEEECQNYIRVLALKSNNVLFVCGTNAYKPVCRDYNQTENEYKYGEEQTGEGLCPYDPNHNSTAVFADGDLYVATVAQFSGADPLIYRKPLRTEQFNLKHLNSPNFVNSLHHEDHVYFFFRETAVEYINCGKTVYSRVARVCTKDKGGPHKYRNRWTSFLKARLNCSVSGEFPFYFNEIQSTSNIIEGIYRGKKSEIIYGVFTTPVNSISGSAVCAFSIKQILETFDGSFKWQEDINSNWLSFPNSKVPEPRPGQCVNDSRTLPEMTLNFIKDHTLMDKAVPSFWNQPLILHTGFGYRYTYITVDPQIETVDGNRYDVLFIGTDNGKVIKVVNAASASGDGKVVPVIIEEVTVFQNGAPITSLLVYNSAFQFKLVVVSQDEIYSIPLHDCERYASTCSDCVGLQDPYCAWDESRQRCTNAGPRGWIRGKFVQNVSHGWDEKCPETELGTETTPTTTSAPTCPPCPLECACPSTEGARNVTEHEPERPPSSDSSPGGSYSHHQASRHDGDKEADVVSTVDSQLGDNGALAGASTGYMDMYSAETLAIAVTTSIVTSLVVGFISGYIFSRRCRNEEVDSPYDDGHYLDQRHRGGPLCQEPTHLNHGEGFLSPGTNNKPINLVLNVPPKNGNGKNANSSADNKPAQKVKKIYL